MRNPGGYAVVVNPVPGRVHLGGMQAETLGEGTFEIDTFTCAHCGRVAHVKAKPKDDEFYFCRNCMARICSPCADHPCIPFLKKIEAQEARDRLRCYGG